MTSLWRIEDRNLIQLDSDVLKLEKNIHDWIEQNPSMLDLDLMIIGREVATNDNKRIKAEYVVPVNREKKVAKTAAKKFPGYFASTHVVCKLRKQATLDFLESGFGAVQQPKARVS